MSLGYALLLGVVQGITEFLPISSTGHLLLTRYLFEIETNTEAAYFFDILIQMGTWVGMLVYFRKDLINFKQAFFQRTKRADRKIAWHLILATLPAIGIGWILKGSLSGNLSSFQTTGFFLVCNGLLLIVANLIGDRDKNYKQLSGRDAIFIGFFQALALLPAISRSAATISGGLIRNLSQKDAAQFAFLMAIPVMPAAATIGLYGLAKLPDSQAFFLPVLVGFLSSAIIGYLSIHWLIRYLSSKPLYPFVLYNLLVGLSIIMVSPV